MKRKVLSLLLACSLALSLFPAALAEEEVTPTPPPWCPEEEYAVFPGSAAYEPENWDILTQTRAEVQWGPVNLGALPLRWKFTSIPTSYTVPTGETNENGLEYVERFCDFGVLLEKALIEVRLLYTHDKYDGPYWTTLANTLEGGGDQRLDVLTDQQRYAILLWTARGVLRYRGVGEELNEYLPYLMQFPQFSLEKLTNSAIFTDAERAEWSGPLAESWAQYADHVEIWLDGKELDMDVPPEVKNERTMVPIRAVAEAIGAQVEWVQDAHQVVMTRGGSTVTMTLDSTTAAIDGNAVEMDVAPYASNGRTLIPARYVAEFFGQKVDWDGTKRRVLIEEDKSVAEGSNLEQWAIQLGMMYGVQSYGANYGLPEPHGKPIFFGINSRTAKGAQTMRDSLAETWGVTGHDSIVSLVTRMTPHGHNDSFQEAAAIVNSLTKKELDQLIARSGDVDKYMWPYTKEISGQWGEKGILAWDLARMGAMVQWGYTAGYLSYEEALELVEPAARLAKETFSSWEEFTRNYLDGYNWWARNDVYAAREEGEAELKKRYGGALPDNYEPWMSLPRAIYYDWASHHFDNSLFETGVIGLPGENEA